VLILRCQGGDHAALAELVLNYSRRLRFYLRKMAGDALADDLLQDVWVDVVRRISRLNDPDAFPAWVYRIARDRAFRELRRRRVPCLTDHDQVPDRTQDDADEWSEQDIQAVLAGLDILAPEHREVLVLRFIEDMSYEQIAAVTARPIGTVRSRIHYAKHALRALLERKDSRS
jgi:RNA polymerase sigma-70 factor (ECF subfamily)